MALVRTKRDVLNLLLFHLEIPTVTLLHWKVRCISGCPTMSSKEKANSLHPIQRTLTRLQSSLKLCHGLASFLLRIKMMSSKGMRRYLMQKSLFINRVRFFPLIFAPGNRKKRVLSNLSQAFRIYHQNLQSEKKLLFLSLLWCFQQSVTFSLRSKIPKLDGWLRLKWRIFLVPSKYCQTYLLWEAFCIFFTKIRLWCVEIGYLESFLIHHVI